MFMYDSSLDIWNGLHVIARQPYWSTVIPWRVEEAISSSLQHLFQRESPFTMKWDLITTTKIQRLALKERLWNYSFPFVSSNVSPLVRWRKIIYSLRQLTNAIFF